MLNVKVTNRMFLWGPADCLVRLWCHWTSFNLQIRTSHEMLRCWPY